MRFHSFILAFLAAVALVLAAPDAPTPSNTPSCTYSCPSTDTADYALGESSNPSDGTLRCDYPATPGEFGLFYCDYDSSTGTLMIDEDAGGCPSTAVASCSSSSRRRDADGVYAAYQRQISERVAAPEPLPQVMNERAALGRRKHLNRVSHD